MAIILSPSLFSCKQVDLFPNSVFFLLEKRVLLAGEGQQAPERTWSASRRHGAFPGRVQAGLRLSQASAADSPAFSFLRY